MQHLNHDTQFTGSKTQPQNLLNVKFNGIFVMQFSRLCNVYKNENICNFKIYKVDYNFFFISTIIYKVDYHFFFISTINFLRHIALLHTQNHY